MTQSTSIFKDNKPTHAKMASYSWVLEMSTKENRRRRRSSFSNSKSNRNTSRRCTFKYFTKTGIFFGLVIILMALPSQSYCRPVENSDYVYAPHHQHHYDDAGGASGEDRFEFSRKILTPATAQSSHNNSSNYIDREEAGDEEEDLELISDDNNDNDPLLNNSSMIVHVIVTSSSSSSSSTSSSSSELETDSDLQEVPQDNLQYTIDDEEEEEGRGDEEERRNLVEEKKSLLDFNASTTSSTPAKDESSSFPRFEEVFPPSSDSESLHRDLELQKIPKSSEKNEPVQDIFSAFYRAFSHPSSSSSSTGITTSQNIGGASSSPSFPTEETITTTFMIRPRASKRQRQSFNVSPERRREFRYRQQERRKLEAAEKNGSGSIIMMMMGDGPAAVGAEEAEKSGLVDVSVVAEAAAQRLELLAKKIDKSDQEVETSFRGQEEAKVIPFSQQEPSSSSPKIAVSVAVTHSKSVAQGAPPSSSLNKRKSDEKDEEVGMSKNAKSESTFLMEGEIHDSSSSPTGPRPLIKSLPRNDETRYKLGEEEKNKNYNYTRHNFPNNFSKSQGTTSSAASTKDEDGQVVEESEIDFRIIKDRNNIIPLRRISQGHNRRYGLPQDFQSSSSYPRAEPSSFIEITTYRPSFRPGGRRKIARTVSGEIGEPFSSNSQALFNFNLNYHSPPASSSSSTTQQPTTTTRGTTPAASSNFRNWQEPEKVWSEPARVWGVPAKVWGEPAQIWSEPAKVWGEPEKVWGETQRQHEKRKEEEDEELMQGDQPPPEPQEEEENNGSYHNQKQREAHEEDTSSAQGTFVILGDDENEGDSIDGDLGRPLMLHHFTIPNTNNTSDKPKETVITSSSISTSVSTSSRISSSTSNNNNSSNSANNRNINGPPSSSGSFSRKVAYFQQHQQQPQPQLQRNVDGNKPPPVSSLPLSQSNRVNNDDSAPREDTFSASHNSNNSNNNNTNNEDGSGSSSQKKSGKKFGYVIEGANVRKYRVEERTPDGFIVGEYGVLNNQNAFLRGVRYTADGTINPRLIHEALMKFLSLRRRR